MHTHAHTHNHAHPFVHCLKIATDGNVSQTVLGLFLVCVFTFPDNFFSFCWSTYCFLFFIGGEHAVSKVDISEHSSLWFLSMQLLWAQHVPKGQTRWAVQRGQRPSGQLQGHRHHTQVTTYCLQWITEKFSRLMLLKPSVSGLELSPLSSFVIYWSQGQYSLLTNETSRWSCRFQAWWPFFF